MIRFGCAALLVLTLWGCAPPPDPCPEDGGIGGTGLECPEQSVK